MPFNKLTSTLFLNKYNVRSTWKLLRIYSTSIHHYAAEQRAVENDDVTRGVFSHPGRELSVAEIQ